MIIAERTFIDQNTNSFTKLHEYPDYLTEPTPSLIVSNPIFQTIRVSHWYKYTQGLRIPIILPLMKKK